jgi:hypothetical protein
MTVHPTNIVVGLGETGAPLLSVLKRGFPDSIGIDPGKGLPLEQYDAVEKTQFLHICLPGDLSHFKEIVASYYSRFVPKVVVIHSTVPVGTTASLGIKNALHSPINGKHADMEASMLKHAKFIGGPCRCVEIHFLQRLLERCGVKASYVGETEVTELGKMLSTTLYGYLIAWEQEVERVCQHYSLDREEVRKLWCDIDSSDYDPKQRYPGAILGHCVMPNVGLLLDEIDSEMLEWIKSSNDRYMSQDAN